MKSWVAAVCIQPSYLSAVGMEVIAGPLKRSPSTAIFPVAAVKSAEPLLPAIGPEPGSSLKKNALLPLAGRETVAFPMFVPVASRTVMETVIAAELTLAMATPVAKAVSSQMGVLVVDEALESGTTAS